MDKNNELNEPTEETESRDRPLFKASRPPNQQEGSFLMRIPQEIRDMIYSYVFCSTRINCGERTRSTYRIIRVLPAPNALALLRTCLQAHIEIGPRWLHEVLFSFETPAAMLDKLTNISIKTRSMIRHVRVSGDPVVLLYPEDKIHYRTPALLKLLPGLQLDRLTVLGTRVSAVSYETINKLIRFSDGWKELYYVSHSSALLGYEDIWGPWDDDLDPDLYLRMPQPGVWQQVLEDRDGPASCPSVAVYRTTKPDRACSVLNAATRVPFAQTLSEGQTAFTFYTTEDASLMTPGERKKEMLVVAKRGRGCDYEVKKSPKYSPDDNMRFEMPVVPWKQIVREAIIWDWICDTAYGETLSNDMDHVLEDAYSHVEDYVWPPRYLM